MNERKDLILDRLVADRHLAQRLPAGLARRYHAVPVAEQDGWITVVMADPDDAAALHAVTSALDQSVRSGGDPSHLVVIRSDEAAIDALVAEVWEDPAANRPALMVCGESALDHDLMAYVGAIGQLLGAQSTQSVPTFDQMEALAREHGDGDLLVVLGERDRSGVKRLLRRTSASVLLVRRTTWPLQKLLLVVRGTAQDVAALDWTVSLARPAAAQVVILAVVPPLPAMYAGLDRMAYDLPALVHSETSLGRNLRQAARWLVNWEVAGTLRLRQGVPEVEIAREVCDGGYDMIVVGAERRGGWPARWARGAATALPGIVAVPLLLAQSRPTAAVAVTA